jgi:hypothetical protein
MDQFLNFFPNCENLEINAFAFVKEHKFMYVFMPKLKCLRILELPQIDLQFPENCLHEIVIFDFFYAKSLLKNQGKLKILELNRRSRDFVQDLKYFQLEKLSISTIQDTFSLANYAHQNPNLKSLKIHCDGASRLADIFNNFPNLTNLDIRCSSFLDISSNPPFSILEKLQTFKLKIQDSNGAYHYFFSEPLPQLETFHLCSPPLNYQMIDIMRMPRLKEFTFDILEHDSQTNVGKLLTKLNYVEKIQITSEIFKVPGRFAHFIFKNDNLKELKLSFKLKLSSRKLKKIIDGFPNLQILALSIEKTGSEDENWLTNFVERKLKEILKKLKDLKYLKFKVYSNATQKVDANQLKFITNYNLDIGILEFDMEESATESEWITEKYKYFSIKPNGFLIARNEKFTDQIMDEEKTDFTFSYYLFHAYR